MQLNKDRKSEGGGEGQLRDDETVVDSLDLKLTDLQTNRDH